MSSYIGLLAAISSCDGLLRGNRCHPFDGLLATNDMDLPMRVPWACMKESYWVYMSKNARGFRFTYQRMSKCLELTCQRMLRAFRIVMGLHVKECLSDLSTSSRMASPLTTRISYIKRVYPKKYIKVS